VAGNYSWDVRPVDEIPETTITTTREAAALATTTPVTKAAVPLKIHTNNPRCSADALLKIMNNMACSDMGDGCHTCRARADWIARHNNRPLDHAYITVASEFPAGCGRVLACKAELAQVADLQEAWEAEGSVASVLLSDSSKADRKETFVKALILGLSLPTSLAFAAFLLRLTTNRRRREALSVQQDNVDLTARSLLFEPEL